MLTCTIQCKLYQHHHIIFDIFCIIREDEYWIYLERNKYGAAKVPESWANWVPSGDGDDCARADRSLNHQWQNVDCDKKRDMALAFCEWKGSTRLR